MSSIGMANSMNRVFFPGDCLAQLYDGYYSDDEVGLDAIHTYIRHRIEGLFSSSSSSMLKTIVEQCRQVKEGKYVQIHPMDKTIELLGKQAATMLQELDNSLASA